MADDEEAQPPVQAPQLAPNQITMRFQRPRDLEAHETSDSLEHWINQFEVYITREPTMAQFLNLNWDASADNYGFEADAAGTAEQKMAACKIFLGHVCSFFKYPYYNHKIKERSTNIDSIYDILRDIYHIKKTADNFFSIARAKKLSTESYSVFYAKIVYLMEQNLAPPNKTVDNISTGARGDKMTVSMLDTAAMIWLEKIDSRLMDQVELDYAVQ